MLTLKQKLTKAEFQRRADEILGQLFREVNAFADVSESAKEARRSQSLADPFAFFTTYLPHYFSQEFAPFHHELVEMLEQRPQGGKNVGAASRRPGRGNPAPTTDNSQGG